MSKRIFLSLLPFLLLSSCVPAAPTTAPTPITESAPEIWWPDTVFYEIFVRSFYDSDSDGIGDINGITEKLDYLNDGDPGTTADLGVTGIWLMPIFPSPSYHGYDVTDYYSINPQYGTMEDFKRLLAEAHKRGIRVIIDLVLNHTSDQHPWFKSAKKDLNSPYRNWYIWSETDPGYNGPWNQKVWHPSRNGYYYGIFESFMPDLNYNNPEVVDEITKIVSFWIKDIGVDGFRLDAAKHLIEENSNQQNTRSTHDWYQGFFPIYKDMNPNVITIGEVFGDNLTVSSGYVKNKEFDLIFNFQLAAAFISSSQQGKSKSATSLLALSEKFIPEGRYAPFLTNHDQNRVMSQLGNDIGKAKVAASLLLTSPGTPFLYYGEEIGMLGQKPDENIRRPMQWDPGENAGFSTRIPWRQPDSNFKEVNVTDQGNDPNSILAHYRQLIQIRREHSALRTGDYYPVESNDPGVYAALRIDQREIILIVVNLSNTKLTGYRLKLSDAVLKGQRYTSRLLLGDGQPANPEVAQGVFKDFKPVSELPPFSTLIIEFQP